ncbi:unnamed protein product [Rhizoctonia solani]|uniref:F-box domain-containing protein n=1 Tax=Rhizoctonia solani TaxID=456999 RepID=A0A8H2Y3X5_9AGAM|nr:unnamed protein product [Rhizoctonia solani]CAE6440108.1 unnamed protein product [Rhizoctonia solani]
MTGSTLAHTLQCWGEARSALNYAIQNYLDRTIALQSDLQTHRLSGDLTSVRDTLPKTWAEDIKVPANYSKLAQAHTHLNQIRNSFLSINALPLEILLRILRLSAFRSFHTRYNTPIPDPYDQDDRKDLLVLTHVCTQWRTILLNTQTFWSRFELTTKESPVMAGERAQAYLDRAPDVPLSFHIDEHPKHALDYGAKHPTLKHFGSQFNRLARLALINFQESRTAEDIILFWMENGIPGALRTLMIRMDTDYWFDEVLDIRSDSLTREQAESFLSPIRVLYLHGLRFDWASSVYHNLVVLRLGGFSKEYSPRIHRLLAIFSASPQLHTLQLFGMQILSSYLDGYEPVSFTHLEQLSLTDLSAESYSLLLPTIFIQSKNLAFRVGSDTMDEESYGSVRAFLTRTNVTRLFIQNWTKPCDCSLYLSAVPNLQTLLASFAHAPGDVCLSALTRSDESKGTHIHCPQLHTIHLLYGSISSEAIQRVVDIYQIQKLRFAGCNIKPSKNELRDWLEPRVADVQFDEKLSSSEIFDWYDLLS